MRKIKKSLAQSTLEYTTILALAAIAIIVINRYVLQGVWAGIKGWEMQVNDSLTEDLSPFPVVQLPSPCSLKMGGQSCTASSECCSGACIINVMTGRGFCTDCNLNKQRGQSCTASSECCSGTCIVNIITGRGVCTNAICTLRHGGENCTSSSECCSDNCLINIVTSRGVCIGG